MGIEKENSSSEYDERGGCGCNTSCACTKPSPPKCKGNKKCKSYSFVTKNPFDVAIAKKLSDNENDDEYLVLLSGNNHSLSDYDHDNLPDWVAMGERPCRVYKTVTTTELIDIWQLKNDSCNCSRKASFDICHPNGYINYYLTNGTNRSQVVEIKDATVDTSQADPTLVLKVKLLQKGDSRLDLDGLYPRMFRVSLVIDQYCTIPKLKNSNSRSTTIAYGPASPPSNYTFAPNYNQADYSKMMGPTTTQTTQQTSQQVAQQQQHIGSSGKNDKDKKKKKNKCKGLKGKEKKECLKKQNKKKQSRENEYVTEKKKT